MPRQILEAGLKELRLEPQEEQVEKLLFYVKELERWNRRFNLVKAAGRELIIKHVLDSLAGAPFFDALNIGNTVLDIGSGAGFPAIPLSLFLADRTFTLCEKTGKKAVFLENTVILLGLKYTQVVQQDYHQLTGVYDVITFRAFTRLSGAIHSFLHKLKPGGYILAYKGKSEKVLEEQAELEALKLNLKITVNRLDVPFLDEERHLLVIQNLNYYKED